MSVEKEQPADGVADSRDGGGGVQAGRSGQAEHMPGCSGHLMQEQNRPVTTSFLHESSL